MKIKLDISDGKEAEIREMLLCAGFELGEDGEYVLSKAKTDGDMLSVKDADGKKQNILSSSVLYTESFVPTQSSEAVKKSAFADFFISQDIYIY